MRWLFAIFVTAGVAWVAAAGAQSPPAPPTFAYLYGRVTAGGENVAPEVQPVVAFVNGVSCGTTASTFVAAEGDDVPDEDAGSTVYVIDVLADGDRNYEREGCGHPGDPIVLYLPAIGRMASVRPLFQPGPARANLEFDVVLAHRAGLPQVASDPSN